MNELIKPGDYFTFNKEIFTTDYFDLDGDLPSKVLFLNNMVYGTLVLGNKIIKQNDIVNISEITSLRYIRLSSLAYTENITFQTGDNNPNNKFSNMATFTITVNEYVNLPPDQIGNNSITLDNGDSYVFTVEDFTSNTTPPYDDPEGDGPYKLKIKTLPADGSKISLNGTLLGVNSEVLFTDIALGLLTLDPTVNLNTHSFNFQFDISDLGSEQYSGL